MCRFGRNILTLPTGPIQCSALYTLPPDAGTLVITDSEPIDLYDDKRFYNSCCSGEGRGCEFFYSRRAIGTCEGYNPPSCCGESVEL